MTLETGDLGPACREDHCITCGDEAVAMRVVKLDPARGLALCENDDRERTTVETALVDTVDVGDVLLVHAAVAIQRLEGAAA